MLVISLYYLIFEPFDSEITRNISYSLIATFIFDTGLNFSKENIIKGIISRRWHNDLYSAFERMRSLREIYSTPNHITSDNFLAKKISASFFNFSHLAEKDFRLMWNLSSENALSYKEIYIKKGYDLSIVFSMFINDDRDFFHKFRMDSEVFTSYPSITKPVFNICNVLSNLLNTMENTARFRASKESLERDLVNYLELRSYLLQDIETVMGHYTQRGP